MKGVVLLAVVVAVVSVGWVGVRLLKLIDPSP